MLRFGDRCHSGLVGGLVSLAIVLPAIASAASDGAVAVVPFEIVDSRVVVPVSIDGSAPLHFVFDNASGGTVVHSSTAEAVGLSGAGAVVVGEGVVIPGDAGAIVVGEGAVIPGDAPVPIGQVVEAPDTVGQVVEAPDGAMQIVAGSSGVVMAGQSSGVNLTLGELVLSDVDVSVLPLTHLTMPSGDPIDGIIGYDVLKTFVVEVDYDAGELRVFDRETYVPADSAVPHGVEFLLGNVAQPCVSGEITLQNGDVVAGMFVLDAGAGADVVLNSPFVREHDLVSRLDASDSPRGSASGVTPDETPVVKSTLPGFAFCGVTLSDVPATLNLGTTGFLAGEGYAGVIGNRILSRYNITYDYAGAVVYLAPVGEK